MIKSLKEIQKKQPLKELAEISRQVAGEGIVMLENKDNVLPLKENEKVAVFGRIQKNYYKSGTGSGGNVVTEYVTNIMDSLKECGKVEVNKKIEKVYDRWTAENPFDKGAGWGQEPWCQTEMPIDDETVKTAADESNIAIIIIGRTAGEDRDNTVNEGSYMLSSAEKNMLEKVSKYFKKTVVLLNVGNVIDMSWVKEYNIKSVLYVWQGGQEGGVAAVDVLTGKVNPSGKLVDTIVDDIDDYPALKSFGNADENFYIEDIYVGYRYFETLSKDKVVYPFGYGISYTDFDITVNDITVNDGIIVTTTVQNVGKVAGKETIQIYVKAPKGKLGKPEKVLCGFAKTKLLKPDEAEEIKIEISLSDIASYDDSGKTGYKSAFVLEAGEYEIFVGNDVRSAKCEQKFNVESTTVVEQLEEALTPQKPFKRLCSDGSMEEVPTRTFDVEKRIAERRPKSADCTDDKGIKLVDVYNGKNTLDEFLAQIDNETLKFLFFGEGMNSPKVTQGTGGAIGGVIDKLLNFGIPVTCCTDGPSGIRMEGSPHKATAMPNGVLIACTWDTELIEKLYENEGYELYAYDVDLLLGPGINIHRCPLNGRNFEYFSEDPLVTGKMAAAINRGMEKSSTYAVIKHFACNNQEYHRSDSDSIISERALREIYLKPFEIAVKEGDVQSIMTSYNLINGTHAAGNYCLCTTILREQWGYDGFVMTDWWPKLNNRGEKESADNTRNLVASQNDTFMVTDCAATFKNNIAESLDNGTLTRGEMLRNAKNILRYILKTNTFKRYVEGGCKDLVSIPDISRLNCYYTSEEEFYSNKCFNMDSPRKNKQFIEIFYKCTAAQLVQTTIRIKSNNSSTSITVNNTGDKYKSEIREMNMISDDNCFDLEFEEGIVEIKRIRFYEVK